LSSRVKITALAIFAICLLAFIAGRGSMNPWVDLAFRTGNMALFLFLLWYWAATPVKNFFRNRSEGIANELNSLEKAKTEAMRNMKQVETRIADLDKERQAILADYKAQGEALKSEIVIKAEKTARQIVAQAKMTAQTEVDKAMQQMRGDLAEEIVAAAEKLLHERLTVEGHEKLINKSLTKVVLN
jgi:F-type H+-transporting ATPase subunit b